MTYAQILCYTIIPASGQFEYIPFDMDLTFGIFFGGDIGIANIYKPVDNITERPLINNLLGKLRNSGIFTPSITGN